jgi:hypothetical protein
MTETKPHDLLARLAGRWRGTARVWFEPGNPVDESPVEGVMRLRPGGRFFEWSYTGSMQGKPLEGFLLVAYHGARRRWEAAWIDSFHMSEGILYSTGPSKPGGFAVLGHYPDGRDGPDWGWRTELHLCGDGRLTLTAFNILPDGQEAKATEAVLERVG